MSDPVMDTAGPGTIRSIARRLRDGGLSAEAVAADCLDRIERLNPLLNAVILPLGDTALATARERDRELAAGRDRGPLHGVPVVVKDIVDVAGTPTTVGSAALRGRVAAADAAVIRRLREAGAVILAKTNMNELAAGITGANATFGDVRNPRAPDRSPGGSSSGTAAAVAAGLVPAGLGTDTGGSIRVPAGWCGIAGLRPSPGLVSLDGVFPRAPSFDCAGPLGRTVEDVALLLDAIADPAAHAPCAGTLAGGVAGLRVGVLRGALVHDVDPAVAEAVEAAAGALADAGARIVVVDLPDPAGGVDWAGLFGDLLVHEFHRVMTDAMGAAALAQAPFGPVVAADLAAGARIEPAVHARRLAERAAATDRFRALFGTVEALLTPAAPTTAPLRTAGAETFARARRFVVPVSVANLPAAVVPCGVDPAGLPVGVQIVGDRSSDATLLRVAAAVEAATAFRQPPPT